MQHEIVCYDKSFHLLVFDIKFIGKKGKKIASWLEIGPLTLLNDGCEHKLVSIFAINYILHSVYSATLAQCIS